MCRMYLTPVAMSMTVSTEYWSMLVSILYFFFLAHLKAKEDHHGRPLGHSVACCVEQEREVGREEREKQPDHANVEDAVERRALLHLRKQT